MHSVLRFIFTYGALFLVCRGSGWGGGLESQETAAAALSLARVL